MEVAMVPAEEIAQTFQANHWLIKRLTDGFSHADSLLQPSYAGNCINWLAGHLLYNRNMALALLGAPELESAPALARYQTGSDPITGEDGALPFEQLLDAFDRSQERLEAALAGVTAQALAEIVDTPRGERPLWRELDGLGWHETYHTGQFELLQALVLNRKEQVGAA
jgi:hypothetical protein